MERELGNERQIDKDKEKDSIDTHRQMDRTNGKTEQGGSNENGRKLRNLCIT